MLCAQVFTACIGILSSSHLCCILDVRTLYFLADAVQEKFNTWLAKTQNFFNEVTSPLGAGQGRKLVSSNVTDAQDIEDIFMAEQTIDSRTSRGILSLAAIVSIEQFSR